MSDAIVIGSGHNGLVAALRLARAGRRVQILERRSDVGGLCAATELVPGYRVPGVLLETAGLRPDLVRKLGLERFGLEREATPAPLLAAGAGQRGVLLHADAARSHDELEALCKGDGDAYLAWRGFLSRVRGFVSAVLDRRPPPLRPRSLSEWWSLGRTGLGLRRLGKTDMLELMRVAPMCLADWLEEHFGDPQVAAGLAVPALAGAFLGPRAPGSAAGLLLSECVRAGEVRGGPAAVVAALEKALGDAGASIRTGAEVSRIQIEEGRVAGVVLADGSVLEAPLVVACCDPKRALLELLEPGSLPLPLEEQVRAVRTRGTTAKVNLALDGPLVFRERAGERHARAVLADGLEGVERAFDAAKYRSCSERPVLDVSVPSVSDPSLAPEGGEVVSILAHCAAHDLEGGWDDPARQRFSDAVIDVLEDAAPGTRSRLVACEILAPADLEERYALSGGHIHHGEQALDQLFVMRPTAALARYRTPLEGLFLGGSGSHPGGGVTGRPGDLAAGAVLGG